MVKLKKKKNLKILRAWLYSKSRQKQVKSQTKNLGEIKLEKSVVCNFQYSDCFRKRPLTDINFLEVGEYDLHIMSTSNIQSVI